MIKTYCDFVRVTLNCHPRHGTSTVTSQLWYGRQSRVICHNVYTQQPVEAKRAHFFSNLFRFYNLDNARNLTNFPHQQLIPRKDISFEIEPRAEKLRDIACLRNLVLLWRIGTLFWDVEVAHRNQPCFALFRQIKTKETSILTGISSSYKVYTITCNQY